MAINPSNVLELLTRKITEALRITCLYTREQLIEIMRKPLDTTAILCFQNMNHEQLWLDCAQKVTNLAMQIIDFCKLVPGFMELSMDDRVLLLRAADASEMNLDNDTIEMARLISQMKLSESELPLCSASVSFPPTDTSETKLLKDTFDMVRSIAELKLTESECPLYSASVICSQDASEMKLVKNTFEMAKSIADLKLTETELALYSAYILFSPGFPLPESASDVPSVNQAIHKALKYELEQTHKLPYEGGVTAFDILMAKLPYLTELSVLHIETLTKFRCSAPHLDFPPLYKELFRYENVYELFRL